MSPALTGGFFIPQPPGKPIQIVPLYKLIQIYKLYLYNLYRKHTGLFLEVLLKFALHITDFLFSRICSVSEATHL